MEQAEYEAEKTRLKQARTLAGDEFEGWRKCAACKEEQYSYCSAHHEALHRYLASQEALRAHYDNVPAYLRPPSRYDRMRARLARKGLKPVWET